MEINRTTDYAVRVVLHLARRGRGGRTTAGAIARAQAIPPQYVSKVLQSLGRAGIVATAAGRGGGVRLTRSPGSLSVLEVVEAMEGPLRLNRCLVRTGECPRDRACPVHGLWARANRRLAQSLRAATFSRLRRAVHS